MEIQYRLLTGREIEKKVKELCGDPMGAVVSSWVLLLDECKEMVADIRRRYEIEDVPVELEQRCKFLSKKLTEKDGRKIWKIAYQRLGELEEIRDYHRLAEGFVDLAPLLVKFIQPEKKRGRPKKREIPWPQIDLANVVSSWAVSRWIMPVPDYFYDPKERFSVEGTPISLAILSSFNQNLVVSKGKVSAKPLSKKRNRETLCRDAHYYVVKNEGKGRTYFETADYLTEEGVFEEKPEGMNEEEEEKYFYNLQKKISRACTRYKQFCLDLVEQNN